ncbi:hypothetical protein DMU35_09385 [Salmonella enterica]|nr:hypothetical protein [Salmonella enterica]ECS8575919.1 hypothetical protein [Salmonella enterica subsp. enterica serovar Mississippi]EAQ7453672.1 hypothetical protein [Salmonella enterica]EAS5185328.1 hypothetical protein [Salmonella enterica]EAS6170685.1 hypothetical protein [Salmonella enterica]
MNTLFTSGYIITYHDALLSGLHNSSQINILAYTRHTSSCMCCGRVPSPQSLTLVSSWGFARLPPSCNSNYLEYITSFKIINTAFVLILRSGLIPLISRKPIKKRVQAFYYRH